LRFRHPHTGEEMTIRAPLGDRFADVVDTFGWSDSLTAGVCELARRAPG
jgi:hypothetical protein